MGAGAPVAPLPHETAIKYQERETITGSHKRNKSKEDKLLPPVGLKNVGNTCYANAALQCLLSTALSHALLDPNSTHIFRRYSSNPGLLALGSGSVDSEDNDSDEDLDGVIDSSRRKRKLARLKARAIRRKNRDKILKHEKCQWLTGALTDVTQIYTASHLNLIDDQSNWQNIFHLFAVTNDQRVVDPGGITRHVNKLSPCLRPYQQEDAHEFLRSLLSTLTLDGHNKKLSSLFDGLLESAVTCQTCHRTSITRDRYMDLSLDIQGDIQDLTGALHHFTQTELLDEHNRVSCSRCRTKQIVSKGLRLATAPTVLVCHLKRFAFDIYGRTTRLSKHVKYPLRLEIGDFMSRANQSKPPPYELVGVLVHAGKRCESGHYLAFIKCGDCWYKANDEVVTKVSLDIVLRQQAYILFYEVEGMRARHGYEGFRKYHGKQTSSADASTGRLSTNTRGAESSDTVKNDCSTSAKTPEDPESSKISDILESVLSLFGSVDAVRDAMCDSDKKPKKSMKTDSDAYLKRAEPLPSTSSVQSSPPMKSSKKNRRKRRESIFRKPSEGKRRSSSDGAAQELHRLRETLEARELLYTDCELSVLSNDSPMIRSVSSNNIFEKEEEAICCYEKESFVHRPPTYSPKKKSVKNSSRSMSPTEFRYDSDDDDRNSDTAVMVRSTSMRRRKSNSAPRFRRRESFSHFASSKKNASDVQLPPLPRRPG